MVAWDDLNARARGLRSRLLNRAALERLLLAPDLGGLARQLDELGYAGAGAVGDLQAHVRRHAAAKLRTLARWSGPRGDRLASIFEDEDRRSLRLLVRARAAGGVRPRRLVSLVPTPRLPEAALEQLAAQPTLTGMAGLLVIWKSPYAEALRRQSERPSPDLLELELEINRVFFARAKRSARAGGPAQVEYVRTMIDIENTWTALALTSSERILEGAFVPGGRSLPKELFQRAARSETRGAAISVLTAGLRRTKLGAVLARSAVEPVELDDEGLLILLRQQRFASRASPHGLALVTAYVLELRALTCDLQRIIWGTALGVPRESLSEALLTGRA